MELSGSKTEDSMQQFDAKSARTRGEFCLTTEGRDFLVADEPVLDCYPKSGRPVDPVVTYDRHHAAPVSVTVRSITVPSDASTTSL